MRDQLNNYNDTIFRAGRRGKGSETTDMTTGSSTAHWLLICWSSWKPPVPVGYQSVSGSGGACKGVWEIWSSKWAAHMVQRRMEAVPLLQTRNHSGIIASSGFHSQQVQSRTASSFKYMLHDNLSCWSHHRLNEAPINTISVLDETELQHETGHQDQQSAREHQTNLVTHYYH